MNIHSTPQFFGTGLPEGNKLPSGGLGMIIDKVTDSLNTVQATPGPEGGMGQMMIVNKNANLPDLGPLNGLLQGASSPQDIVHMIFSDDVLYRIVRLMLTIIVASLMVECGMWYHIKTVVSSYPSLSNILSNSINQCFYVAAFLLFMSMILLLYAIKKGVDNFDRTTFTYYTSIMFILVIVRIALQTIATTNISDVFNDPVKISANDPAVVSEIQLKIGFCKSPATPIFIFTTIAWIIAVIFQGVATFL